MSGLSDYERAGVNDLFQISDNIYILKPLAKILSRHLLNVETNEEAFDIIFLHSENSTILLNKRIITKDILLKYLHINNVPVGSDFTKSTLIDKIQNYWKEKFTIRSNNYENISPAETTNQSFIESKNIKNIDDVYPIQLLAKQFSEWFFNGWNKSSLKENDFWSNATLNIRLIDSSGEIKDYHETIASNIIQRIYEIQQKYGFILNPNTTSENGSRGTMDLHGLVMVLTCGTLHIKATCVGVFESTFGLVRDIEAENNWKIKNINLLLKSAENNQQSTGIESEYKQQSNATLSQHQPNAPMLQMSIPPIILLQNTDTQLMESKK